MAFVDFCFFKIQIWTKGQLIDHIVAMGFPGILTTDVEFFSLLAIPAVNDKSLCPNLQGYQAAWEDQEPINPGAGNLKQTDT